MSVEGHQAFLDTIALERKSGEAVIEAHRCGLLSAAPDKLRAWAEWHSGPDARPSAGAVGYVRGPINLFDQVRGGNVGFLDDPGVRVATVDGRAVLVGRPRLTGGLMTADTFDLPRPERSAMACEYLAVVIEDGGSRPPDKPGRGAPQKYPKSLEFALQRHAEGRLKPAAVHRICKERFPDEAGKLPKVSSFWRLVVRYVAKRGSGGR